MKKFLWFILAVSCLARAEVLPLLDTDLSVDGKKAKGAYVAVDLSGTSQQSAITNLQALYDAGFATVTNPVVATVAQGTSSTVIAGDAVKAAFDESSNAVAMVVHPDSRITYHETIQSAAQAMTSGSAFNLLRPVVSVTGVVFQADNAAFNFNRLPIIFNTATNSAYSENTNGRYETAIRIISTNSTVNGLVALQQTETNYPTGANLYTLDYGGSADLVFNDCTVQFNANYRFTNQNPKTIVDVAGTRIKWNGGAVVAYASVTNNGTFAPLYVNHGNPTQTVFYKTAFIQNYNAYSVSGGYSLMGGESASYASNMFLDCSYNREYLRESGTGQIFYNVSALNIDAVSSLVFPGTASLFTAEDCATAVQGKYERDGIRHEGYINNYLVQPTVSEFVNNKNRWTGYEQITDVLGNSVITAHILEKRRTLYSPGGGTVFTNLYYKTEVMKQQTSAAGHNSVLVAPNVNIISGFPVYASVKQLANDPSKSANFFSGIYGTVSVTNFSGSGTVPSTIGFTNRPYVIWISSATNYVAGDVIKIGTTRFATVDESGTNDYFKVRDVRDATNTSATNGMALAYISGGVTNDLTQTYVSNNLPTATYYNAVFGASDGWHYLINGSSVRQSAEVEIWAL